MIHLQIIKNTEIPIYRQIIEQITSLVNQGKLNAGDKLPPERELASELNISRGTITKAYQELERNNIIEVIRGSGSFVSEGQDVLDKGRKERAIALIDETLSSLEKMKFSSHEIKIFFDIMLMEREKKFDKIRIATVDCNPEALAIFKKQIGYISNVEITRFLLEDIIKIPNMQHLFDSYNLIITTSTHYSQLKNLLDIHKQKIIEAAVSPSQQTIIDIAKIPQDGNIGVICFTERFYKIIINTLISFEIEEKLIECIRLENINEYIAINNFLLDKKTLIIPSDSLLENEYSKDIDEFINKGGNIIRFEYQIQRGTLIYIEECIFDLLSKKNKEYEKEVLE